MIIIYTIIKKYIGEGYIMIKILKIFEEWKCKREEEKVKRRQQEEEASLRELRELSKLIDAKLAELDAEEGLE